MPEEDEAGTLQLGIRVEPVEVSEVRVDGGVPEGDSNISSEGNLTAFVVRLDAQGVEVQIAAPSCPSLANQLSEPTVGGQST